MFSVFSFVLFVCIYLLDKKWLERTFSKFRDCRIIQWKPEYNGLERRYYNNT